VPGGATARGLGKYAWASGPDWTIVQKVGRVSKGKAKGKAKGKVKGKVKVKVEEQVQLQVQGARSKAQAARGEGQAIWKGAMGMKGGWVIEVDIRRFFDALDHGQVREILSQRVRDGVVVRLIGKWLNAGILEGGEVTYPEAGTPQGGVISPLLANVYLHHVLDGWWAKDVQPRMKGRTFLVRYADDFVMGFEHKGDAERVMEVLPKRFARYGLELHPEKTRMVEFQAPDRDGDDRKGPRPGSFDFLGFTHYWGRSRKGTWVVKRKTAANRFCRVLTRLNLWLRKYRHEPVKWQHQRLSLALKGHDSYYGITGNRHALDRLRHAVERLWQQWLDRRSWRARMPWERFQQLLDRYPLPAARVVQSVYRVARP